MIRANAISKFFEDQQILDALTLEVRASEIVSILGASGCGKSTFLAILAGLLQADSGSIETQASAIAYLPQHRDLLPWRTLEGNIALGMEYQGISKAQIERQCSLWLERMGLQNSRQRYPAELSGGMKRRATLAQVLAANPSLLLLDEPLTALDIQSRRAVAGTIRSYCRETKATAVLVTHSIEEAIFLSDRIVILSSDPATIVDSISLHDLNREVHFQTVLDSFLEHNALENQERRYGT